MDYLKDNNFMEEYFKALNYMKLWLMRRGKLKRQTKSSKHSKPKLLPTTITNFKEFH